MKTPEPNPVELEAPAVMPPDDDEDDENAPRQRLDPELRSMGEMIRTLNKIPESARGRVVAWLSDRFATRNQP